MRKDNRFPQRDPSGDQIDLEEYVALKIELDALRQKHGIVPAKKEGTISRLISGLFEKNEKKKKSESARKSISGLLSFWAGQADIAFRQSCIFLESYIF